MKATELMIGDFIIAKNYGIKEIIGIRDFDGVVEISESEDSEVEIPYDDIKPISLTPEILKKNGWVWRTRYDIESLKLLSEDGHCLMSLTYGKKISVGGHEIEIKYVHELQHALRLCGLEDLADNFKI